MDKELESLGSILENNLVDEHFKHIHKVSMFFSFWSNIVGRKFEKKSKPYSIKVNKLYISCQNSIVAQELNMFKSEVIKKLGPYAKGLELQIDDIVFNYKNWNECNTSGEEELFNEKEYSSDDFNNVEIDEKTLHQIKENINKNPHLNNLQKEKYFKDIINNLKANILRKKQD